MQFAPRKVERPTLPVEIVCKPCSFMKLRDGRCHWPLWDDPAPPFYDQRYCGAATAEGTPYCAGHCTMSYRSPGDRRLERFAAQ